MSHFQRFCALFGITLIIGMISSGTATAAPAINTINLGKGIITENSTVLPDGSLAISASDGLHHILRDGSEGEMFLQAESLGGVILKDGKLVVAVGNDGGAALAGVRNGTIWQIDPGNPANKQMLMERVPAPNGLIELPDGRIAYSTSLGRFEGIHIVGEDVEDAQGRPRTLNDDFILTPNGLSMGPDGDLYVCSTAGGEVVKVDLATRRVTPTGKFVPLCDDLTVTSDGRIYAASLLGVWDPAGFNLGPLFIPREKVASIPPPAVSLEEWLAQFIPKFTSIKPAGDGGWVVTDMNGDIHLIHF